MLIFALCALLSITAKSHAAPSFISVGGVVYRIVDLDSVPDAHNVTLKTDKTPITVPWDTLPEGVKQWLGQKRLISLELAKNANTDGKALVGNVIQVTSSGVVIEAKYVRPRYIDGLVPGKDYDPEPDLANVPLSLKGIPRIYGTYLLTNFPDASKIADGDRVYVVVKLQGVQHMDDGSTLHVAQFVRK